MILRECPNASTFWRTHGGLPSSSSSLFSAWWWQLKAAGWYHRAGGSYSHCSGRDGRCNDVTKRFGSHEVVSKFHRKLVDSSTRTDWCFRHKCSYLGLRCMIPIDTNTWDSFSPDHGRSFHISYKHLKRRGTMHHSTGSMHQPWCYMLLLYAAPRWSIVCSLKLGGWLSGIQQSQMFTCGPHKDDRSSTISTDSAVSDGSTAWHEKALKELKISLFFLRRKRM